MLADDEVAAVAAVVRSGQLAQGPRVGDLEAATAGVLGIGDAGDGANAHAAAVSSGTAGLYVALRTLGVGDGDKVLIPAFACASLSRAVRHTGATPSYVDCDPVSLNPDPHDAAKRLDAKTTACIVPHMFGRPADVEAFVALGVPVIEDCAQTLGVSLGGRPVGSFGAVAVCSFYATKLVAGGEGGMVLSADDRLIEKARALRDCEQDDSDEDAFNFKMSDLHAAIATVQLRRLQAFLSRRRLLAARYLEALRNAPVELPAPPPEGGHAWFRFVVGIRGDDLPALQRRCDRLGVACRRPVGRLPREIDLEALPGCRQAWETSFSLPLYPGLSDEEADSVPTLFSTALRKKGE
jgi:dTDP-4-amino-4,6-dideoxygalactose transaminase